MIDIWNKSFKLSQLVVKIEEFISGIWIYYMERYEKRVTEIYNPYSKYINKSKIELANLKEYFWWDDLQNACMEYEWWNAFKYIKIKFESFYTPKVSWTLYFCIKVELSEFDIQNSYWFFFERNHFYKVIIRGFPHYMWASETYCIPYIVYTRRLVEYYKFFSFTLNTFNWYKSKDINIFDSWVFNTDFKSCMYCILYDIKSVLLHGCYDRYIISSLGKKSREEYPRKFEPWLFINFNLENVAIKLIHIPQGHNTMNYFYV